MHVSKDLMWWRESEKTWNLNKAVVSLCSFAQVAFGKTHGMHLGTTIVLLRGPSELVFTSWTKEFRDSRVKEKGR